MLAGRSKQETRKEHRYYTEKMIIGGKQAVMCRQIRSDRISQTYWSQAAATGWAFLSISASSSSLAI